MRDDARRPRRRVIALAAAAAVAPVGAAAPDPAWHDAALAMRRLAESWGDQPYGAVVVRGGVIVGLGPSRVVLRRDPDAHAEREALRDARERLGGVRLDGAILVSTSRPCALCEAAAAEAGIARMWHGPALTDAGVPRSR